MEYQVTAGYVTVPTAVEGGGVAHVDIARGEVLPADVPDDHVQVLLGRGHIAPVDKFDEVEGDEIEGDGSGDALPPIDPEAQEELEVGPVDSAPAELEVPDEEPVPDGTAAQILEWVAGDPAKAVRAMQAEAGRDKPRSGLITDLGKITG